MRNNGHTREVSSVSTQNRSLARKSEGIELTKHMRAIDAVAAVFSACLLHLTSNEEIVLAGDDPEGIHEMRIALRTIRSALSDFPEFVPIPRVTRLKDETGWLLTNLGMARDWDVFLTDLLTPVELTRPEDLGLAELRLRAEAKRERGYRHVQSAI